MLLKLSKNLSIELLGFSPTDILPIVQLYWHSLSVIEKVALLKTLRRKTFYYQASFLLHVKHFQLNYDCLWKDRRSAAPSNHEAEVFARWLKLLSLNPSRS